MVELQGQTGLLHLHLAIHRDDSAGPDGRETGILLKVLVLAARHLVDSSGTKHLLFVCHVAPPRLVGKGMKPLTALTATLRKGLPNPVLLTYSAQ